MTATHQAEMVYLAESELDLSHSSDDVRGMVVVDPNGHRLGEVDDLVIDACERRARLLSVISGGISGLTVNTRLIPVETVARVDDRVHLDRDHADVHALATQIDGSRAALVNRHAGPVALAAVAELYDCYGVPPLWKAGTAAVYFHFR